MPCILYVIVLKFSQQPQEVAIIIILHLMEEKTDSEVDFYLSHATNKLK
jgi:hypothetical protein